MGDKSFERKMIATRKRISVMSAPYSIAISGVIMGVSIATVVFMLVFSEKKNWFLLSSLAAVFVSTAVTILKNIQMIKSKENNLD